MITAQTNLYRALLDLIPASPLQVATVAAVDMSSGTCTITWPGGQQQIVRGTGVMVGGQAFVRGGVIEGPAPALELVEIEV
jgi:hypothetical protein